MARKHKPVVSLPLYHRMGMAWKAVLRLARKLQRPLQYLYLEALLNEERALDLDQAFMAQTGEVRRQALYQVRA